MTNYFNFLNFYVWVFIALTLPNLLSSQTGPNVPQTERVLCYSTTTKEVQKLSSTVNYSEIQTHELLRTKVITYKKAFQVSLDDSDNYITKYRYLYHKNLFPDWHIAPDETIIDNVGTRQVFSTTSTIYEGGWFGSDVYKRQHITCLLMKSVCSSTVLSPIDFLLSFTLFMSSKRLGFILPFLSQSY